MFGLTDILVLCVVAYWNAGHESLFTEKVKAQNRFKKIMDKSGEGILIIED